MRVEHAKLPPALMVLIQRKNDVVAMSCSCWDSSSRWTHILVYPTTNDHRNDDTHVHYAFAQQSSRKVVQGYVQSLGVVG